MRFLRRRSVSVSDGSTLDPLQAGDQRGVAHVPLPDENWWAAVDVMLKKLGEGMTRAGNRQRPNDGISASGRSVSIALCASVRFRTVASAVPRGSGREGRGKASEEVDFVGLSASQSVA